MHAVYLSSTVVALRDCICALGARLQTNGAFKSCSSSLRRPEMSLLRNHPGLDWRGHQELSVTSEADHCKVTMTHSNTLACWCLAHRNPS